MFETIERKVNFIIDITSAWPPKGSICVYIYTYICIHSLQEIQVGELSE